MVFGCYLFGSLKVATLKTEGVKITVVGGVSFNHHSGDVEGCNGVNKIPGLEGHKEPCNGSPRCGFQSLTRVTWPSGFGLLAFSKQNQAKAE